MELNIYFVRSKVVLIPSWTSIGVTFKHVIHRYSYSLNNTIWWLICWSSLVVAFRKSILEMAIGAEKRKVTSGLWWSKKRPKKENSMCVVCVCVSQLNVIKAAITTMFVLHNTFYERKHCAHCTKRVLKFLF